MPSVSIAVEPDIQAAANFASAMQPLPAKATMTTRVDPLDMCRRDGLCDLLCSAPGNSLKVGLGHEATYDSGAYAVCLVAHSGHC